VIETPSESFLGAVAASVKRQRGPKLPLIVGSPVAVANQLNTPQAFFRTCYRSRPKAIVTYLIGLLSFYYATYVVVSLAVPGNKLETGEALFHLAWWTLVPPSWFFIEWFIWFDNHDTPGAAQTLRTNQDLASKFWAAVLALMISLKIVDAVESLNKDKQAVREKRQVQTAPSGT
jgi:hypothetical protein